MKILYHLTAAQPRITGTDAVFQEVGTLQKKFGGKTVNLFPLARPARWFPRPLYGLHKRTTIREFDKSADLHHVYHHNFYPFPVLRGLKKPVIFSVTAGLDGMLRPRPNDLDMASWIIVSNERDRAILKGWGYDRYRLIRPGIDVSRFEQRPLEKNRPFTILLGSAPWVRAQFVQKGVDVILQAAQRMRDLRIILLWRGLLVKELEQHIRRFDVQSQVEVINEKTDVNEVLARCHATVVLASTPKIVKAYPHSLIESLAAGKPVITSQAIPVSDYVREKECGVVVPSVRTSEFTAALRHMIDDYDRYLSNARHTGARDFDQQNLLQAFDELYRMATGKRTDGKPVVVE